MTDKQIERLVAKLDKAQAILEDVKTTLAATVNSGQ